MTERVDGRWFVLPDRPVGEVVVEVKSQSGGAPFPGAVVELHIFETGEATLRGASADDQGRALFVGVPPATKFRAAAAGSDFSETTELHESGVGVVLLVE